MLNVTAGTNNQLSGFNYDPAGNMTNNGVGASYVYDDENRLIAAGGYSYLYDGDGERVEKCTEGTTPGTCAGGATGTLYWRGWGSDPLSETDLSGNIQNVYIFFGGQRIARSDSTGAIHYYFSDHLGSHGVVENATGSACEQDVDYYPYGGEENDYCSTQVAQHYKFTGKERDTESGLDNFGARYSASNLGRFMTPDWAAKPINVPYASFGDPQTLNLYTYVENSPLNRIDADGHADDFRNGAGDGSNAAPCGEGNGTAACPDGALTASAQSKQLNPAQNTSQGQNYNVKVVDDTTTPSPFVPGVVNRDVTYQAVDSSGKTVSNKEISLHETPLPGKEGGDAKNYGYCGGKGCSNSDPAPKAEGDLRAGRFTDRMSQGTNGPAAFKQTYTVEGKPANIIWPTKNGNVTATSQTVKINADRVVIIPEVQ